MLLLLMTFALVSGVNAEPLRIASWNIRCVEVKDSLQGDAWSKRAPEMAGVIRFRNFEVLGMQEVDSLQRETLTELLPGYRWVYEETYEGNPIAFLEERFDLKDHGVFWYSRSMIPGAKDWDSKHPRFCNWVLLLDKKSQKEFFVFNTHWDNRGDTARVESARMTISLVSKITGDTPSILMGDFNVKPERKPLKMLKENGFFLDARETAPIQSHPEGSFTKFRTNRHSEETLDHMFYRGGAKILRFGVLRETYYDGETFRFPSDHHPIMGEFELP